MCGGYKMRVDAAIEVCSGGPWKQRGSLPTLQDGEKKTSGKKLISRPISQPFPAAGAGVRRARIEEEETT